MDLYVNFILVLLYCLVTFSHLMMLPTQATDFEYCDNPGHYPVTVTGIETFPDPLVPLQEASFGIFASTGKNVSDGKLEISFYYFWYLPIYWETHVLCSLIHPHGCPVTTGSRFLLELHQRFPSYAQPGPYTVQMNMFDGNEKQLACLNLYTSWWSSVWTIPHTVTNTVFGPERYIFFLYF